MLLSEKNSHNQQFERPGDENQAETETGTREQAESYPKRLI